MKRDHPSYPVYRGLQKPLVFRSFHGKFIYWGLGSLLAGLLSGMLLTSLLNLLWGLGTMTLILGGGLGFTAWRQRRGPKPRFSGIIRFPFAPFVHVR